MYTCVDHLKTFSQLIQERQKMNRMRSALETLNSHMVVMIKIIKKFGIQCYQGFLL